MKLIAIGDTFLKTKDDTYPFDNVKKIFAEKDILFGNLETVLSCEGEKEEKFAVINTKPENVEYLIKANFDVINIANNHILDLGITGFKNTINELKGKKINYIGGGIEKSNIAIIKKKSIKIGFIGYCSNMKIPNSISVNLLNEKIIINEIRYLKEYCDVIVVSLHWGIENVLYPSPKQIKLAHNMIDNGADIILGHHPHIIQGIERYKNGLIAYSLGNFNFDYNLSKSTQESFILSIAFDKNGLQDFEIIPVFIDENYVPNLIKGSKKEILLKNISKMSKFLETQNISEKWWFEQIAEEYLKSNFDAFMVRIKLYGISHFFKLLRWLINPFSIQCYFGIIRKKIKSRRYNEF